MNVTAKSKWKSVPLDAQLMARGFSEGLMGIEELSSYDLVQVKKKTSGTGTSNGKVTKVEGSKIISGKNALKRPLNVEGEEIEEEPKKKKKTRQKRKPKKKVPKGIKPDQSSKNESVIDDKELPIQLPGWKDFSVPLPVLRALKELGFEEPTPIQRETMPAALNGHADIVGAAETGSGKTLAFAIPMIYGILADREKDKGNSVTPSDEDNLKGVPLSHVICIMLKIVYFFKTLKASVLLWQFIGQFSSMTNFEYYLLLFNIQTVIIQKIMIDEMPKTQDNVCNFATLKRKIIKL